MRGRVCLKKLRRVVVRKKWGEMNMLLKKKDFCSAVMELVSAKVCRTVAGLSLPVIQCGGILQAVGAGALILSAYLGCLIQESLNGGGIEFSAICADRQMVRLSDESGEFRAANIEGGLHDYKG